MTRWARSGSTQKHKKPPEDPTPWEEFVLQKKMKSIFENGKGNVKNTKFENRVSDQAITNANEKESKNKRERNKKHTNLCNDNNFELKDDDDGYEDDDEIIAERQKNIQKEIKKLEKKLKKKQQKYKRNISADDIKVLTNFEQDTEEINSHKMVEVEENSKQQVKEDKLSSSQEDISRLGNSDLSDNFALNSPAKSSLKLVRHEKLKFMDRLKKRRSENGITLLPPKSERKLYKMKKGLREKGVPGENIRDIIRQVRRKEELKFRKTLITCYKCRKIGHVLSECPLLATSTEEGTGICFKCGSTEHTSSKCSIKALEFPFATCFICKEQGHLSRACPQNKHGVYPKGGSCNICGNVNHFKKDCPTLRRKKNDDEEELTVGTLTGQESVEDLDYDKPIKFVPKKSKIVTF